MVQALVLTALVNVIDRKYASAHRVNVLWLKNIYLSQAFDCHVVCSLRRG